MLYFESVNMHRIHICIWYTLIHSVDMCISCFVYLTKKKYEILCWIEWAILSTTISYINPIYVCILVYYIYSWWCCVMCVCTLYAHPCTLDVLYSATFRFANENKIFRCVSALRWSLWDEYCFCWFSSSSIFSFLCMNRISVCVRVCAVYAIQWPKILWYISIFHVAFTSAACACTLNTLFASYVRSNFIFMQI